MNRVEVPADAIPFEDYIREVASAEIDALEHAMKERNDIRCGAGLVLDTGEDFESELLISDVELDAVFIADRAMQELRDKVCRPLRTGFMVAYGEAIGGFPIAERIPAELWEHLVFDKCVPNRPANSLPNDVWYGNMVPSPEPRVPRFPNFVWRGHIVDALGFRNVRVAEVALSQQERCRNWLRKLVAAGNKKKPKYCRREDVPDTAATSYFGEAESTFSVTKAEFDAIWAEVTRGHDDWRRAGRKRNHN